MSDWQKTLPAPAVRSPHPKVLRVTMNRPDKYNATDSIMHTELVNVVARHIDGDDTVNCVIIQGAGGKVFSAGGDFDLIEKNMKDYNALLRTWKEARDIVYNVINCSKPIVSTMRRPGRRRGSGRRHPGRRLDRLQEGQDHRRPYPARRRRRRPRRDRVAAALRHGQGQVLPAALRGGRRRGGRAHRAGLAVRRGRPARGQGPGGRHQARRGRLQTSIRFTKYALNNWLRMMGPSFDASTALEMLGFMGPEVKGRPRLAPREAQAQVRSLLAPLRNPSCADFQARTSSSPAAAARSAAPSAVASPDTAARSACSTRTATAPTEIAGEITGHRRQGVRIERRHRRLRGGRQGDRPVRGARWGRPTCW